MKKILITSYYSKLFVQHPNGFDQHKSRTKVFFRSFFGWVFFSSLFVLDWITWWFFVTWRHLFKLAKALYSLSLRQCMGGVCVAGWLTIHDKWFRARIWFSLTFSNCFSIKLIKAAHWRYYCSFCLIAARQKLVISRRCFGIGLKMVPMSFAEDFIAFGFCFVLNLCLWVFVWNGNQPNDTDG